MLVADAGGGGAVQPTIQATAPAAPPRDPKVDDAVQRTIQVSKMGPEPDHAVAYQMQQTLNDSSLSQAQKDEYIAQMAEYATGPWVCTPKGDDHQRSIDAVGKAFEDIGTAWSGDETPQLRQQVTDAIGRDVNSGRLDANDLYALVDPSKNPQSDGARQLLTGIRDGAVLNRLSDMLLTDAKREGYNIDKQQNGPATLVAAADIANMAAANGSTASAKAIVTEIGAQMAKGPVAGDMTLMQAMMATTVGGQYGNGIPGRTGFDALSGLVNSANSSDPALQKVTDSMFATLVRSGDDKTVGGLDQAGDRKGALGSLDTYMSNNIQRLNENGWRYDSAGSQYENLVQDFTSKVLLDSDNPNRDGTTDAITTEMNRLGTIAFDPHASANDRNAAAQGLGELVGSAKAGANDAYANQKGDNEAKIETIRFFTDKITDKIADLAGPLSDAVKAGVDTGWGAAGDAANNKSRSEIDQATKGITDLANGLRIKLGDLDNAALIAAYDQRFTEHVPD